MTKRITQPLFQKDPIMASLVKIHSPVIWHKPRDLFVAITRNIIGQQLSGRVADVIIDRFEKLVVSITPDNILSTPDEKLRAVGMSWAKVKYVKELSRAVSDGSLDLKKIRILSDEEVIIELTKVKGIGRWTAEMILIFHLLRPDVFSLGDLGLRTAVSKLYKVDRNNLKKIAKISEKWKPHRSLASRYLWKSLDNE